MTEILLMDELRPSKHEISQISANSQQNASLKNNSASRKRRSSQGKDSFDPYTSLSKQKTTVSVQQNSSVRFGSNNSSLVQSHLNQTKEKSSLMLKNDLNLTNNTSGIGAPSSSANTYFASSDQIRVERESLERIHTFSLKEPNEDLDKSEDKISNSYK